MRTSPDHYPGPQTNNLKTKLVVVADLGRLRAYQLETSNEFSRPRLRLIETRETDVTRHLSEEVTDQAGRFRKEPAVVGALSDGEEHNLDLERRHRAVRLLAQQISRLIASHGADGCYLAADNRLNQALVDELDQPARSKIQKTICANLSKLNADELVERFCEKEPHVHEQRQT